MVLFIAAQFLMKQFMGGTQSTNSSGSLPSFDQRPIASEEKSAFSAIPQNVVPIWSPNTPLDLAIYLSPSPVTPDLKSASSEYLVANEKNFRIDDWNDRRHVDTTFTVPKEVQKNGTLWAHIFVSISGHSLNPQDKTYDTSKAYHFGRPLTQYLPKKRVVKTKKLLGSADETTDVEDIPRPKERIVASYYHPNISISVIPDSGTLNYPTMHPALRQYMVLESSRARDASGQNGWYYPILFTNTFWQLRDHMTELNDTVKELPLYLDLNHMSNWKFGIYASIDESMKQNQRQIASGGPVPAGGDGSELEEFKRILVDTNVYLLATTGIVSVLHMVFEMLAFKSDIVRIDPPPTQIPYAYIPQSHWRNKKDNVGVSVRTILANVFMQTVIFLYLLDNSEGTSWMILFGQGFGIVLEAWKITKTVDVRVRPAPVGSVLPYHITFEDKHKLSETEKKTQEYDEIAFKYLYMVAVPLLLAYAGYSLVYETHKSWYSFVITTLVGSVYAYGFLMMVPSLYINYRLKVSSSATFGTCAKSLTMNQSVAHMPRKAMTYKFLNTFIVSPMP